MASVKDSEQQRAQLVDVLWKLKQALAREEQHMYVHFSMVLKDPDYRASIIEQARGSKYVIVRELGEEAASLNLEGGLLGSRRRRADKPDNPPAHGVPAGIRAGVPGAGLRASLGFGLTALSLLLIMAVAAYLFGDNVRAFLGGTERVSGSIVGDVRWNAGQTYILDGLVFVEAGGRLTIDAGTRILGEPGSGLVITRNASLYARGRRDAPIVFTSARPVGEREAGDWGGLVLLGNAPINRGSVHVEGIDSADPRGDFGGNNIAHSCGVLEYVRIEYAGFEIGANNELNGLTLGGCGAGSIVRHVQVHRGLDDGIEVFGGNVDIKYAVISGAGDDAFDWDMGWTGRVQFLVVQQYPGIGDNGFEGDNWKSRPDAQPRSSPEFYNVTMIGSRDAAEDQRAMTIRRGSGGSFHNFIITGFPFEAIDLVGPEMPGLVASGELSFGGIMLYQIGDGGERWFADETAADDDGGLIESELFREPARQVQFGVDPMLPAAAFDLSAPSYLPAETSAVRSGVVQVPSIALSSPAEHEFWDEAADYLGALRPGDRTDWLQGWTDFPVN